MERLQELIDQLKEQFDRKAEPSQMLLTTRLLDAELTRLSSYAAANRGSAKVAVMMPSSMKIYTGQSALQEFRTAPPEVRNGSQVPESRNGSQVPEVRNGSAIREVPSSEPEFVPAQKTAAELRAASEAKTAAELRTASEGRAAAEMRTASARQSAAVKEPERGAWPFDPLADIPTLAQQQVPRELNDVIGNNGATSLNDKLKGNVLELSAALNDTPVRDLKKAIGVNDRFVFISQLFRGDEVMYERSIKTINGFRILPEAEYWMERELKVKLGWDENREATKHFYQLVKRRFS
ncbi:MAG TPA: hypothetical protein VNS58_03445 [Puia sp.]|nr:hypothetical protein [Puia sp.]